MKKDRLIVLTDAVLAIIMTILILELEKPTTPSLEAFWDLRQ
ncbi:MAG: TMEM175 family protein, partial [Granulicatella adiacens]